MPYGSIEEIDKDLPDGAKRIYMGAFNSAWSGTCEGQDDREECAHAIAWSAVKKVYEKVNEEWVHKASFDFIITKSAFDKATGEMRWAATASDTLEDSFGQRMSLELFKDFISRSETSGLPYLSVSHYSDQGGSAVAGITTSLYVDGNRLKAKGLFNDTVLGNAAFKAVSKSVELKEDPAIRISIGFYDFGHEHLVENATHSFVRKSLSDKCTLCSEHSPDIFTHGQLVHLALTRVPVNERTSIEGDSEMTTRKEDASSIVGEALAEELDAHEVMKSEAMVVKAKATCDDEEDAEEEMPVEEKKKKVKKSVAVEPTDELIAEEEVTNVTVPTFDVTEVANKVAELLKPMFAVEKSGSTPEHMVVKSDHPLATAVTNLVHSFDNIQGVSMTNEDKLRQLQPALDELGESIRVNVMKSDIDDTVSKSDVDVEGIVQKSVASAMQPIVEQLSLITQQLSAGHVPASGTPAPRNLQSNLQVRSLVNQKSETPSIRDIARRSVGL